MKIPNFELERVQSIWEHQVDYNLTESGLHPFTVRELLDDDQLDQLLSLRLGFGSERDYVVAGLGRTARSLRKLAV